MASVRKKNDKWQVQVRRKGFPAVSQTFLKKSDASEWARMMESKLDRRDLPSDPKLLKSTKLSELIERYRDEIVVAKKCASVETIILNAFLRHKICQKFLSDITLIDWIKYRDERVLTITGKSLKRELSPVVHMFRVANKEWGYDIRENPLSRLSIKSDDRRRERRLSPVEELKLTQAAKRTLRDYLSPVILLALETGMRRGELLSIRTDHVDFRRRLLSVPETKNGESRTIPLTEKALEILRERFAIATDDGRLFSVSATALQLSWQRTCRRANIENLHFHDLRHEAISRFFEMGLTTPEVALISGHKDIRMLFRYAHGTQKAILEKFQRSSTIP
ncbi:MAG: site-specific integrase [Rhizobium sp.]|nr:site-specific integrase [Rhizobium sp.]